MKKKIFVLHEIGIPSHYIALEYLAENYSYVVAYREFQHLCRMFFHSPRRAVLNIMFLLSLPLRKPTKIVLAMAPYNQKLRVVRWLLRRHEVYYHTSYTCWDGTRAAHTSNGSTSIERWRRFLNYDVKHIFAVSELTKSELVSNDFARDCKITVVNHSFRENAKVDRKRAKTKNFLYVGRLVPQKGIEELLKIFSKRHDANLTIIGYGSMQTVVEEYVRTFPNIRYEGKKNGFFEITPYYKSNSFLLLNSYRTPVWEELFGMAIIEAMSCGCVPLATKHPGPKEIVTDGVNGLLCEEGEINTLVNAVCDMSDEMYQKMRSSAIETGHNYHGKIIAERWKAILA